MKTFTINGETFEVIKPRRKVYAYRGWFCDEYAIFYAYGRPSIYKIGIWRDWVKWARNTEGVKSFEITGHNGFQFTIGGLYVDENGKEFNIYITKCHRQLIEVNS